MKLIYVLILSSFVFFNLINVSTVYSDSFGDPDHIFSEIIEIHNWEVSEYIITSEDNLDDYTSPVGNHTLFKFDVKSRVYVSEDWTYVKFSSCSSSPPPPFFLEVEVNLTDQILNNNVVHNYREYTGIITVCNLVGSTTISKDTIEEYEGSVSFIIKNSKLQELPEGNYIFLYNVFQNNGNAGYGTITISSGVYDFKYDNIFNDYNGDIIESSTINDLSFMGNVALIPLILLLRKNLLKHLPRHDRR